MDQLPVSFEEVAVCFTAEEWELMDPDQKALHEEVMNDNLISISFLGDMWKKGIISPQFGKRIKDEFELGRHTRTGTEKGNGIQEKARIPIVYRDDFADKIVQMVLQRSHTGERNVAIKEESGSTSDCVQGKESVYRESGSPSDQFPSHGRINQGGKPYRCQECGKCFAQRSVLVRHCRVHTGEKPHKCQVCGKCFGWKSDLLHHTRIHTGEKPFRCQWCWKCFVKNSDLVRHHRVHTGEKPHRCEECGKCFTSDQNLLYHKRIHSGEKPFKCQECWKCFIKKADLVRHQKTHSRGRP